MGLRCDAPSVLTSLTCVLLSSAPEVAIDALRVSRRLCDRPHGTPSDCTPSPAARSWNRLASAVRRALAGQGIADEQARACLGRSPVRAARLESRPTSPSGNSLGRNRRAAGGRPRHRWRGMRAGKAGAAARAATATGRATSARASAHESSRATEVRVQRMTARREPLGPRRTAATPDCT